MLLGVGILFRASCSAQAGEWGNRIWVCERSLSCVENGLKRDKRRIWGTHVLLQIPCWEKMVTSTGWWEQKWSGQKMKQTKSLVSIAWSKKFHSGWLEELQGTYEAPVTVLKNFVSTCLKKVYLPLGFIGKEITLKVIDILHSQDSVPEARVWNHQNHH